MDPHAPEFSVHPQIQSLNHALHEKHAYTIRYRVVRNGIEECCVVESAQTGILYVRKMKHFPSLGRRAPGELLLQPYLPKEHPNVLHILGNDMADSLRYCFCMEYCSGEDLATAGSRHWPSDEWRFWLPGEPPSPAIVVRALRDLTRGVAFLHHGLRFNLQRGRYQQDPQYTTIIHGDIKAEKVLLRFPGSESTVPAYSQIRSLPDFVLGGFGLASTQGSVGRDAIGSESNVAPEIHILRTRCRLQRDSDAHNSGPVEASPGNLEGLGSFDRDQERLRVTPASDLYSLGLCIFKLAAGHDLRYYSGVPTLTLPTTYDHPRYDPLRRALRWLLEILPGLRPCTVETMLLLLADNDRMDAAINGSERYDVDV